MKLRIIPILCLLGWTFNAAAGKTSVQSQIESALDSWSSRDATRDAILKAGSDPIPALISIAKSEQGPELRRVHAINLLATFKTRESKRALAQIAKDGGPKFRCLALQGLVELNSQHAIPVLVSKLNDQAVCMKTTSTDPAQEHDVYVSDEAVRLLEQITGRSFDHESGAGHRATKPRKEWWATQKRPPSPSS